MGKIIEKHITIEESVFKKLRLIAKTEDRTMRAVVTRLINLTFDKHFSKDELK